MTSEGICDILIPQILSDFPTTGHIIPEFQENLVGVGPMCDADCTVIFSKHTVTIYSPTGTPITIGWRETAVLSLWRMYIMINPEYLPPLSSAPAAPKTPLPACSSYDLPRAEALVLYFHTAAGFLSVTHW